MFRRLLRGAAAAAVLFGTTLAVEVSQAEGATTSLHLSVHTPVSEVSASGGYKCGLISTSLGASHLIHSFTVSVMNAKGKVDKNAVGSVTVTVATSQIPTCPIVSPDQTDSTLLFNTTEPIVRGVATFSQLNAAQPGLYILDIVDNGLVYSGPSIILDVAGPNDVTSQTGTTNVIFTNPVSKS